MCVAIWVRELYISSGWLWWLGGVGVVELEVLLLCAAERFLDLLSDLFR
jgi:hypothetical protein